jgi:hypothetical protein
VAHMYLARARARLSFFLSLVISPYIKTTSFLYIKAWPVILEITPLIRLSYTSSSRSPSFVELALRAPSFFVEFSANRIE